MSHLKSFADLIKSGEVVAFPTETVYGLGADAWNPSAIKKVFEIKGRPADNPLIVHISELNQLDDFASEIPPYAELLLDKYWPGPLSLILNKKPEVLDLITAGLSTVAVRMPNHPQALELISLSGPLVAPSANTSGKPSPTKASHVLNDFGPNFPVIDGGPTEVGIESTVLDLTGTNPAILRPGKIGKNEIESVLGTSIEMVTNTSLPESPKSPGQKYSHYKPAAIVKYGEISSISDSTLYLVQSHAFSKADNVINYDGDLELFSQELYDRFRQADIEGFEAIHIEKLKDFQPQYPSYYEALLNRIQKAVEH